MDYSGINLRQSTVFDLTNDKNILVNELELDMPKESYSKFVSIESRIMDFLALSSILKDKPLENEVHKQFENELDHFKFE